MKVLSIETSCDDTSAAVVDDVSFEVLSCCTISRLKDHAHFGGVVPEIASRHHEESIFEVVNNALEEASLKPCDLNAIAVTTKPGLIGSILVGTSFAKGFSVALDLPLIEVDHVQSHATSAMIEFKNLKPPFLSLVASGGHTSVIDVKNYTEYKTCFQTIDDAVGEVYDKVARSLGIPYPGGSKLDQMALIGECKYSMPVPKISNFSFSGIKTWALNISKNIKETEKNNLAASLVYGISNYVSDHLIRIARNLGRNRISIGGGVACSKVLRSVLEHKCDLHNIELFIPNPKFCTDNAAMIGFQGIYNFKNQSCKKI